MNSSIIRPLILGILILLIAAQGQAQEFTLTALANIKEAYNDNIFFDADNAENDFITTLTAGLALRNRSEIMDLNLSGEIAPFFYRDHDKLDDIDQTYQGRLDYQVSERMNMNARGAFYVDNQADREIEETGLAVDSNKRHRTEAGGGAGYDVSETLSISLSYNYQENNWRNHNTDNEDTKGHTLVLGSAYKIDGWIRESSVTTQLGYNQYNADTSDIKSVYGGMGLQSRLNEVFSFQINAGVRYMETRYDEFKVVVVPPGVLEIQDRKKNSDSWGGLGNMGLNYAGERTRWGLTLSHDLRPASGDRGPSNLTRATASINHRLQDSLSMGLYTSYFVNKANSGEYDADPIDEKTFTIRPRMRWEFLDHFTLEGAYAYTHLTDNEEDTTTERHLASIQLGFAWPILD